MKRITKGQRAELQGHAERLRALAEGLAGQVERFNEALAEQRAEVEEALERYNEAVRDADYTRDGINSDQSDHFDNRPERWQESDKGQAYSGWIDQWSEGLEEAEIDFPDPIEAPEPDAADKLEALPESPEG